MTLSDKISSALEDLFKDEEKGASSSQPAKKPKSSYSKRTRSGPEDFTISGFPVYNLNWDDLGLGLVRSMGFAPTKSVQIKYHKGKWSVTGAYAKSSVLIWIAAGAGGIIYFLRDLISQVEDWSWLGTLAIAILPMIINLFIRPKTLEFEPYELEMLGYDPDSKILVLSTLTQPGGVLALRMDMPSDKRRRAIEETRLMNTLQQAHAGFTRLDGLATYNYSRLREWSVWGLAWVIVIYLYYRYFIK
jgi:hypothetical protein